MRFSRDRSPQATGIRRDISPSGEYNLKNGYFLEQRLYLWVDILGIYDLKPLGSSKLGMGRSWKQEL